MKTQNQEVSLSHTPGPWAYVGNGDVVSALDDSDVACSLLRSDDHHDANARLIAAAPELLEALQAYQSASAMSVYGDASDFVWPAISMRAEGEPSWGWNCEKHGLGYQRSCICCRDDFARHKERKDCEARYARDEALRNANDLARAAIAKATGAI